MNTQPIPNWPGYLVSSNGTVSGPRSAQLKSIAEGDKAYYRVQLWHKGKHKAFQVHVLVIQAFGPPKPGDNYEVDHIDGDRLNNDLSNLEWVTPSENCRRRDRRIIRPKKTHCLRGHIRNLDNPGRCMTCHRERERHAYHIKVNKACECMVRA